MKKFLIYIMAALAASACDPLVDDKPMGGVLSENDLDLVVKSVEEGGNEILLENRTQGIGSLWNYGVNKSTLARQVIVLPFMGNIDITFTGICDAGTVTTTRTVEVTRITKEIDEEWIFFTGGNAEGKTWVWSDENDGGAAYGCGGYGYSVLPDWGGSAVGDETPAAGLVNPNDEISFDLDGGANFTLRLADGTEKKGTFVFDMSKKKDDWSIGTLEFKGATIPCAYDYYEGGDEIFSFDILTLTEDELILAWAAPGALFQDPDWATLATYWCFKKKQREDNP